ncbi:hypothetical protein HHK36_010067 [Tetracentron sinense]|uniref:Retrotransposon gag domain-containing protein n=1 Tax=Tetracentron sinense TaxID=13715 RepID=A0A835DI48_TETSI|nr:hypothetical protein HHK36_010067 [Tetracentron sinense]
MDLLLEAVNGGRSGSRNGHVRGQEEACNDNSALSTFRSWDSFIEALQIQFGSSSYDDPMETITRLRQTSTVSVYKSQFEVLSNRLRGLSESYKLSCFLSGLKDEIRLPVRMLHPNSLSSAFGLAKIQEEYVTSLCGNSRGEGNHIPFVPLSSGGSNIVVNVNKQVTEQDAVQNYRGNNFKSSFPIKRVSPLEMKERREKGLCYFCDEKWNPSHHCKKAKIYLMEGMELFDNSEYEVEELTQEVLVSGDCGDKDEETPEISLHAIVGALSPRTMRFSGLEHGCSVVILMDTGSTHNFLDPLIPKKACLKIGNDQLIEVHVANGDRMSSEGMVEGLDLKWLRTLGQESPYGRIHSSEGRDESQDVEVADICKKIQQGKLDGKGSFEGEGYVKGVEAEGRKELGVEVLHWFLENQSSILSFYHSYTVIFLNSLVSQFCCNSILGFLTNHVINTLAVGVEVRALSIGTLREVIGCLLEMNQEVVKIILESKKDIWKNQELFELVEEYFENSLQTMDFYTAMEKCLKRARDSQLIIQVALQQFAEEDKGDEVGGKKYLRTLEELKNFRASGDPFTEELFNVFQLVYKQQILMLEKLRLRKSKLDKKLKSVKG